MKLLQYFVASASGKALKPSAADAVGNKLVRIFCGLCSMTVIFDGDCKCVKVCLAAVFGHYIYNLFPRCSIVFFHAHWRTFDVVNAVVVGLIHKIAGNQISLGNFQILLAVLNRVFPLSSIDSSSHESSS